MSFADTQAPKPQRFVSRFVVGGKGLISSSLLCFGMMLLAGVASADDKTKRIWEIDPDHSSANFEVRHLMVSTTQGTFSDVRGDVVLDPTNLAKSRIDATIKVRSLSTGNKKRDKHLFSKDFFHATKFKEMTFRSRTISKGRGHSYVVNGDLTIRGKTKRVTLVVGELSDPVASPMAKDTLVRGARATTEINRKDFGIAWNKSLESGRLMVGEKVKITLDLELHHKKAASTEAEKPKAKAASKTTKK